MDPSIVTNGLSSISAIKGTHDGTDMAKTTTSSSSIKQTNTSCSSLPSTPPRYRRKQDVPYTSKDDDDDESPRNEQPYETLPSSSCHSLVSHASSLSIVASADVTDDYTTSSAQPCFIEETLQSPEEKEEENIHLRNFCVEHQIFLHAVLDLLHERDKSAPELGMLDPIILKAGPLKKASHIMNGVWKVKFVEVRRGMFSYYAKEAGTLRRKNIPLEASTCKCRAVKLHQKALALTPGGAILELSVNGVKRLWMAHSRKERQAWIQTINDAMVGGSVTRGGEPKQPPRGARSPWKRDLQQYVKTQHILRNAKSKQEYLAGLRELTTPLQVPVQWIAQSVGLIHADSTTSNTDLAFYEPAINLSVEQLWRDLARDSVQINGELFHGGTMFGPQRIVGGLMRKILTMAQSSGCDLSEAQAVKYARDILLSGNRTRSGGDSYFCVNTLCKNPDRVVVVPSGTEAEPVSIVVNLDESEESRDFASDKSGWIKTKGKPHRPWHKLFFVMSEGTLSFYENALPRPHRLRGQLVLHDASISVNKRTLDENLGTQFIVTVATRERERFLLFESEDRLLDWLVALEYAAKAENSFDLSRRLHRRRSSSRDADLAGVDTGVLAEQVIKEHVAALNLDPEVVDQRIALYAKRNAVSLRVSIQAVTTYKVCTLDPQGDDTQDTWATLRALFVQGFRLSGGPNSRILRGEEVVRVSMQDCLCLPQESQEVLDEPPPSPWPRRRKTSSIFRSFGSEKIEDVLSSDSLLNDSQS